MKPRLRPTLWRTCRTLANRRRLRMLMLLDEHGEMSVSAMAREMECQPSRASEALRALNARGLLRVRRSGRYVYYGIGGDPSVSDSVTLLRVVVPLLRTGPDALDRVFRAVTAFTHPRRQRLIYELSRSEMTLAELRRRTRISKPALRRHLQKLITRGMVERNNRRYRPTRPRDALRKALLGLALDSP